MWNKKRQSERGFTLVEVIVMATVTTVGLLSILVVADRTIQTSDANENRVAAANLAREGIELVRAARDSNWQALNEQEEIGVPGNQLQAWTCYAAPGQEHLLAVPLYRKPACSNSFGNDTGAGPSNTYENNYRAILFTGDGVPAFVPLGTGSTTTKNGTYRLCLDASIRYVPSVTGGLGNCPTVSTSLGTTYGGTFYRRVNVQRGRVQDDGSYSLRVRSYVTWSDNPGGDILIEEYLTNWRK